MRSEARMNPRVDAYINRSEKWPEEMARLRPIPSGCELTEEIEWGKPRYSHEDRNIVILQEKYAPKILDGEGFRDRSRERP